MAKKNQTDERVEVERASPRAVMIALVIAFLCIAIIGVVTVVIPEVSDEPEDAEGAAAGSSTEAPSP